MEAEELASGDRFEQDLTAEEGAWHAHGGARSVPRPLAAEARFKPEGEHVPVFERTRTLRPSTSPDPSPYEVDTKAVGSADLLRLAIFGGKGGKRKLSEVEFRGADLACLDSFYFRVESARAKLRITFIGAQPVTVVVK